MARYLYIPGWCGNFERSQATRSHGRLPWIAQSTNLDHELYLEIVSAPNGPRKSGPATYGVYRALLSFAANCRPRGVCAARNGASFGVTLIAERIGMPVKIVSSAIERLIEIGLVGVADSLEEALRGNDLHENTYGRSADNDVGATPLSAAQTHTSETDNNRREKKRELKRKTLPESGKRDRESERCEDAVIVAARDRAEAARAGFAAACAGLPGPVSERLVSAFRAVGDARQACSLPGNDAGRDDAMRAVIVAARERSDTIADPASEPARAAAEELIAAESALEGAISEAPKRAAKAERERLVERAKSLGADARMLAELRCVTDAEHVAIVADTIAYAEQHGLRAGWVRKSLRDKGVAA